MKIKDAGNNSSSREVPKLLLYDRDPYVNLPSKMKLVHWRDAAYAVAEYGRNQRICDFFDFNAGWAIDITLKCDDIAEFTTPDDVTEAIRQVIWDYNYGRMNSIGVDYDSLKRFVTARSWSPAQLSAFYKQQHG